VTSQKTQLTSATGEAERARGEGSNKAVAHRDDNFTGDYCYYSKWLSIMHRIDSSFIKGKGLCWYN